MEEPVKVALAVIVDKFHFATVVALRPQGSHLAGKLEFPGGKFEDGERPVDCALREGLEETGLALHPLQEWKPIIHQYPERLVQLYPILCLGSQDDPLNTPWHWVDIDTLDHAYFPAANRRVIDEVKELPKAQRRRFDLNRP